MKSFRLISLASISLAGLFSFSALIAAQEPSNQEKVEGSRPAMKRGPDDWQQRRERRFRDISGLLNLTPEQQTRAKRIFDNAASQARDIMPQMRKERQEMMALLKNPDTAEFDAKIAPYAKRQGELHAKLIENRMRTWKEFYSILNPEQKQKASDLHDLMSSRFPMGGRGRGGSAGPTE
jgi:Spy/CpxP family protein refolding chaperone